MFDEYLKMNHKKTLKYFSDYCYKNYKYKLNKLDIEDIYNDSIVKILESKSHKNGTIENYHSYFLTVLKTETYQKLKKNTPDFSLIEDEYIEDIDIFDINFKQGGYDLLIERAKTLLTFLEYQIFMMLIMNNMTYREIAKNIDYSAATVYLRNKEIFIKIKKEIKDNYGDYFEE